MSWIRAFLEHRQFSGKIAFVVVATFLPPLAVICFLFYGGLFVFQLNQKPLTGLEYLTTSLKTTQALTQHRELSLFHQLDAEQHQYVEGLFTDLSHMPMYPKIQQQLAEIRTDWQSLSRKTQGQNQEMSGYRVSDGHPTFEAYTQLIDALTQLSAAVAVQYRLTAFENAHNSILGLLYSEKLPSLVSKISQTTALAIQATDAGTWTPDRFVALQTALKDSQRALFLTRSNLSLIETSTLTDILNNIETAIQQSEAFLTLIKTQVLEPQHIQVQSASMKAQSQRALQTWQSVLENIHSRLNDHANTILQNTSSLLITEAIAILAALIGGLLSFSAFNKVIVAGLKELSQVVDALAHGDLTRRASVKGSDEMAILSQELNSTCDKLEQSFNSIHTNFSELQSSVQIITEQMIQTSNGSEEQATEMQYLSSAMSELTSSAEDVEAHTVRGAQDARSVFEVTHQSDGIMRIMVHSIGALTQNVQVTNEAISALAADTLAIGHVTEVIREIAEQTNLLALNAAIESARAGEQGRGFAVVADEVRSLAQRTRESTDEIHNTIEKLQKASVHAQDVIKDALSNANQSSEQVREAQRSLEHIRHSVEDMANMNEQIASSATEQSSTTRELHSNITHIQLITQDAKAQIKTATTIADQLLKSATALKNHLGYYKVRSNL